jgi:hypothetical protein
MEEAGREARIKALDSISDASAYASAYAALREEFPDHAGLAKQHLAHVDRGWACLDAEQAAAVGEAADAVIARVDVASTAMALLLTPAKGDAEGAAAAKAAAGAKKEVADALMRKARALRTHVTFSAEEGSAGPSGGVALRMDAVEADADAFAGVMAELRRWADVEGEDAYGLLRLEEALRAGHPGRALATVSALLAKRGAADAAIPSCPACSLKGTRVLEAARAELCDALGWPLWSALLREAQLSAYPTKRANA